MTRRAVICDLCQGYATVAVAWKYARGRVGEWRPRCAGCVSHSVDVLLDSDPVHERRGLEVRPL